MELTRRRLLPVFQMVVKNPEKLNKLFYGWFTAASRIEIESIKQVQRRFLWLTQFGSLWV